MNHSYYTIENLGDFYRIGNPEEVRVCALDGKTIDNMFEPGFAALVITKDK